jgi:hypothetical protein
MILRDESRPYSILRLHFHGDSRSCRKQRSRKLVPFVRHFAGSRRMIGENRPFRSLRGFERNGDVTPSTFRAGRLRGVRTTHTISSMTRLLAAALLLLGTVSPNSLAFCGSSSKVEKVTGRIVAYSSDLACLNGNGYWSMLIRVQDRAASLPPRFVQVQFSLPCAEHPEWLDRKPSVQKFRLKRQPDADSVLKEFYDCSPDSADKCPPLRMWRPVPGTEDEKLPFGQRVPSYRSIDLPLAPVV